MAGWKDDVGFIEVIALKMYQIVTALDRISSRAREPVRLEVQDMQSGDIAEGREREEKIDLIHSLANLTDADFGEFMNDMLEQIIDFIDKETSDVFFNMRSDIKSLMTKLALSEDRVTKSLLENDQLYEDHEKVCEQLRELNAQVGASEGLRKEAKDKERLLSAALQDTANSSLKLRRMESHCKALEQRWKDARVGSGEKEELRDTIGTLQEELGTVNEELRKNAELCSRQQSQLDHLKVEMKRRLWAPEVTGGRHGTKLKALNRDGRGKGIKINLRPKGTKFNPMPRSSTVSRTPTDFNPNALLPTVAESVSTDDHSVSSLSPPRVMTDSTVSSLLSLPRGSVLSRDGSARSSVSVTEGPTVATDIVELIEKEKREVMANLETLRAETSELVLSVERSQMMREEVAIRQIEMDEELRRTQENLLQTVEELKTTKKKRDEALRAAAEVQALQEVNRRLQLRLAEALPVLRTNETEIKDLKQKLEDVENSIMAEKFSEERRLRSQKETELAELAEKMVRLKAEVQQLQPEITRRDFDIRELKTKVVELQGELDRLKEINDNLKSVNESLKTDLDAAAAAQGPKSYKTSAFAAAEVARRSSFAPRMGSAVQFGSQLPLPAMMQMVSRKGSTVKETATVRMESKSAELEEGGRKDEKKKKKKPRKASLAEKEVQTELDVVRLSAKLSKLKSKLSSAQRQLLVEHGKRKEGIKKASTDREKFELSLKAAFEASEHLRSELQDSRDELTVTEAAHRRQMEFLRRDLEAIRRAHVDNFKNKQLALMETNRREEELVDGISRQRRRRHKLRLMDSAESFSYEPEKGRSGAGLDMEEDHVISVHLPAVVTTLNLQQWSAKLHIAQPPQILLLNALQRTVHYISPTQLLPPKVEVAGARL